MRESGYRAARWQLSHCGCSLLFQESLITDKTGVLTGGSEIETVRARDKDNLFVYTAGGKGFIVNFPTQASVVGIK